MSEGNTPFFIGDWVKITPLPNNEWAERFRGKEALVYEVCWNANTRTFDIHVHLRNPDNPERNNYAFYPQHLELISHSPFLEPKCPHCGKRIIVGVAKIE